MGKEYRLEAGYGFLTQPDEPAFYQANDEAPWSYLRAGLAGGRACSYRSSRPAQR
ncbi:MAG: AraC family ligand binding domain-containing protein [Clostridium sp.]|nr:AraC family ligand binding domain-containing protein [Clostridium sp.]